MEVLLKTLMTTSTLPVLLLCSGTKPELITDALPVLQVLLYSIYQPANIKPDLLFVTWSPVLRFLLSNKVISILDYHWFSLYTSTGNITSFKMLCVIYIQISSHFFICSFYARLVFPRSPNIFYLEQLCRCSSSLSYGPGDFFTCLFGNITVQWCIQMQNFTITNSNVMFDTKDHKQMLTTLNFSEISFKLRL